MTTYGSKSGIIDKIGFAGVIGALILLFIALTQPIWNGRDMVAELKSDCDRRGGVVLQHKFMFGDSYECASRLDGENK